MSIKERNVGCGEILKMNLEFVFLYVLLYPLAVPATSLYVSAKLLRGGEDEKDDQTTVKGLKMFEHLGQYFPFITW